jgi:hypothetical protein
LSAKNNCNSQFANRELLNHLKIQPVKLGAAMVLVKLQRRCRYFYKADGVQHGAPKIIFYGYLAQVYI